jgi:hypothetical protein
MKHLDRRSLLRATGAGIGAGVLGSAWGQDGQIMRTVPHHLARARRVVWLFQSGGPSQLDLFDNKPLLRERQGEDLPPSVRKGQRLTAMSGNQATLPLVGSAFSFAHHGQSGAEFSDLLPHTASIADQLCIVRSMHTEAINHDPAVTFMQTGSQIAGRPSIGSWLSLGLGSNNPNLPTSCVLISKNKGGQPLYARLWGSGFLPSKHQAIPLRAGQDPILYLSNPPGVSREQRKRALDALGQLHTLVANRDPSALDRQEQAELAWRLQASVPEVADMSDESDETFELYGEEARDPGSYAANCLMARRLLERGVRFVQLFHKDWDQHGSLVGGIKRQCRETDQASAALVRDLARRGMLEDTLVIWGGEFGRTAYSQGPISSTEYGRDHHGRCFTIWMAGGGIQAGLTYGETDPFGYNITRDPVHVHDLQALILHLLGIDHERLTWKYQGRHFRLTDVFGRVPSALLG